MRIRSIILTILVIAGLSVIAAATTEQPALAQGGNLIQNPGFEGAFYTFDPADYSWVALYGSQREDCKMTNGTYLPCNTAQTPAGWIPWWISHNPEDPDWKNRMPEYKIAEAPFMNRVHSGSKASQYFTFHSTHTAGLLQVVNVPAYANVRFSIWGQAWSSASDANYSDYPTPVNMRVGIDPTGGTNPYNPAIVWSDYKQPYDVYQQFVVEAQAQGEKVTVFTISSPDEARKHNDVYWDDAELVVIGAGAAPAPTSSGDSSGGNSGNSGGNSGGDATANSSTNPAPAPASVGPTATPDAEGVIYAEVQSGDSFWSIAARHGISIEEIYELNNAGEGDFVQVGQKLIVGYAEENAAKETEEADSEAAPTDEEAEATAAETEAEATATATPTPVPPTPTAEATGGEICLSAYLDENQNGQRDAGEPLKSSVAFTISNGEAVVSNYVSDGTSEPYCITGLEDGSYRVTRSTARNEVLTTPGEWAISLAGGTSQSFAFGSYVDEEAAAVADTTDSAVEDSASLSAAEVEADAESAQAEDGGVTRILVIAAVVVAVLLLVGVLVVVLSARRSTV